MFFYTADIKISRKDAKDAKVAKESWNVKWYRLLGLATGWSGVEYEGKPLDYAFFSCRFC